MNKRNYQRWSALQSLGLFALVLTLNPISVCGAVIYQQDFESVSSGWSIGTYAQGTIQFAEGGESGASFATRSLELSHNPASTTRLTSAMPNSSYSIAKTSTDEYTFGFDLRLSRTNTAGWVTFMDRTISNQLPMFIQITSVGDFVVGYWNGTSNTTLTLLSGYSIETTYSFVFTTDPSTGLFSAMVSGGTAQLTDGGFRRTSGGADLFQNFNTMEIYNDGGSASGAAYNMYVDNIVIQSIPEPSTLASILVSLLIVVLIRSRKIREVYHV